MKRLRPRTTVLSGATIGLIAGAAVYGAIASSASPVPAKTTKASVAAAPVSAARCAAGQKLEKGVCIVHVVRTVVLPGVAGSASGSSSASSPSSDPSASNSHEAEPEGAATQAAEAKNEAENEVAEHAKDSIEHPTGATQHETEVND